MGKISFSLKTAFASFTIALIGVSVVSKHEIDRRRAKQRDREIQSELDSTEQNLQAGKIYSGQLVSDYLKFSKPRQIEQFDRYTKFDHGFPPGLSHGTTIIAKDGVLVKAYSWSCLGGSEFFDVMSDAEEAELNELIYANETSFNFLLRPYHLRNTPRRYALLRKERCEHSDLDLQRERDVANRSSKTRPFSLEFRVVNVTSNNPDDLQIPFDAPKEYHVTADVG